MDHFSFPYLALFQVKWGKKDIDVIGWNSPYKANADTRSIDDIRHAILEQNVINLKKLKLKKVYQAKINCCFIQNLDGQTWNQVFSLKDLEVLSEEGKDLGKKVNERSTG